MSGSVAAMRWRLLPMAALMAAVWASASGCDSGKPRARSVNVPGGSSSPQSDSKSSVTTSSANSFKREAHVILPVEGSPPALAWERFARIEASAARSLMVIQKVKKPTEQAARIRQAVKDGASFIILAPEKGATDLPAAIADAKAQNVPVILVNGQVAGLKEPVPVILPQAYAEPARSMVQKARDDLKFHGLPLDSLLIAVNRDGEDEGQERVKAIEDAAKAAGFANIKRVEFEGGSDGAIKALRQAFKDDPKVSALIAEDAPGFDAATRIRTDFKSDPKREIVTAGFCAHYDGLPVAEGHNCSSVYQLNSKTMMQHAFRYGIKLTSGEKTPDVTRVPFLVGIGDPRVELQFRDMNNSAGKKKSGPAN